MSHHYASIHPKLSEALYQQTIDAMSQVSGLGDHPTHAYGRWAIRVLNQATSLGFGRTRTFLWPLGVSHPIQEEGLVSLPSVHNTSAGLSHVFALIVPSVDYGELEEDAYAADMTVATRTRGALMLANFIVEQTQGEIDRVVFQHEGQALSLDREKDRVVITPITS